MTRHWSGRTLAAAALGTLALALLVVTLLAFGTASDRAAVTLLAARAALSGMPWWRSAELTAIESMALAALGPPPADPSNRFADDARAVALGAQLFADARLSATGTVSCASCHQASRGFQDGRALGLGVGTTARRTMSVTGTAYSPWLFWDGRADSPWSQALGPLENASEHGGTRALYVHVLTTYYRREYEALFGALPGLLGVPPNAGPLGTPEARRAWAAIPEPRRDSLTRAFVNLGKAIAAYERTLTYSSTRFDRYAAALVAGQRPRAGEILSADEAAGLRLFVGKARCATCHNGPRFTDDAFHNTGIAEGRGLPSDDGRVAGADIVARDPFNCLGAYSDVTDSVQACQELRFLTRGSPSLVRAYRPPSLRGVAERAPYMHAGQLATLRAVLDHYNAAPRAPRGQSELHPLHLTPRELDQLERFLHTLSADSTVKLLVARLVNIPSHNGTYRASLIPLRDSIELNRAVPWTVEVRTAAGALVSGAALELERWMPDEPRVRVERPRATVDPSGRYRIEGLRFDRRGWWNVRLRISAPVGTDSLAFNLVL